MVLLFLALVTGSLVYCVLAVIAAVRYRSVRPVPLTSQPPVSVLKPLAGIDDGLEENLRTFFEQKYSTFEILFAVRSPKDPVVPVIDRMRARYPHVPSQLLITGEPPYANAKVFSLDRMLNAAKYDLIVMADSDVRVTPGMLAAMAAEFQDERVGLITCPYRAVPGASFWTRLEAVGINTEFMSGVFVARLLDGMKFALGPTIAARREALERIGGFDAVKDFLAEDYVMGKLTASRGYGVILSSYVIEHRIGSQKFVANVKHRLRWNRSTRRSRPMGYVGQLFTHPLPLALLLCAVRPAWWPMLIAAVLFRAAAGWATASLALDDPLTRRLWWLVPLQDLASFLVWIGGFFGNTILWRGRRYYILPDGRFELVP